MNVVFYVACISFGVGPLAWAYSTEVSPERIRAQVSGGAVAVFWGFNFLFTNYFKELETALTQQGVFFAFADDFLAEDAFDAERDVRAFFADERRCEPAAGEASERVRASELSEGSPADGTKATTTSVHAQPVVHAAVLSISWQN